MRAAFYECEVTPPLGGYMWGYYSKQIAKDVFERLYTKAVVVEEEGNVAAIISIDTCSIPADMHDAVTKRIYEYTKIRPENVCITSNHTHRGAPVHDSPEIECFSDGAYKDVFYRLAADAVILAYMRLGEEAVTVKFGKGEVNGIAFNRNGVLEDGTYVTHLRGRDNVKRVLGKTDPDLSIIYFEKDNEPIGAIVNFSCHQDCTGGVPGYTGDYASVIAQELKKEYGNDFVSLFVLGTCGDINSANHDINVNRERFFRHRKIGKTLAEEAVKIIADAKEVKGEVAVVKETVTIKRRLIEKEDLQENLNKCLASGSVYRARNLLTYFSTNEKEESTLYVQGIKIGNVLISALPGEIYVQVGLDIKEKSPFEHNIVVENCNSYLGYVPTKECFNEKSELYEISLCYHSNLIPEAAEILTDKALEISKKLYN